MQKVSLPQLLRMACYIGSIGYGGPAIIAQIQHSFVHKYRWISEKEFADGLNIAQLLPGATTVTLTGYIGLRLAGVLGMLLLPLAYITPAFTAVVVLSELYFTYAKLPFVHALMTGLGAFVVALLLHATIAMGKTVFKNCPQFSPSRSLISLTAFATFLFTSVNVIFIILLSGLLGGLFRLSYDSFKSSDSVPSSADSCEFFPLALLGISLGAAFFIPSTQEIVKEFLLIGTFSFGGGFTAVPLIQEAIVNKFNWLTMEQLRDGIALGQITPGPVFITAAFIGYRVLGLLGAVLATVTVFTPSLCLIIPMARLFGWLEKKVVFRSITQGLLAGFVGILLGTTLQFGVISLSLWQTWIIFLGTVLWMIYYQREPMVPIIITMLFSVLFL